MFLQMRDADLNSAGRRHSALLANLAMLSYALLIAGSFSVGALAAPHIGPAAINAVRFLLATALLGGIIVFVKGQCISAPRAVWRFLLLGALMAAFFILMFVALAITDPVSTGAVFTLIPIMAALLGRPLLGQRTTGRAWIGLVIAGIGALWVIFRADLSRALAFEVGRGEALFFIGCACQALYAPLVRLLNQGEGVLEFTFWTLAGCTLCLTIFAVPDIAATDWRGLDAIVWLAIAYLAVLSTAMSFLLLQFASLRLPAAKIFPYTYLVPCFVMSIEAALGHGWPSLSLATGAVITLAGLILLMMPSRSLPGGGQNSRETCDGCETQIPADTRRHG